MSQSIDLLALAALVDGLGLGLLLVLVLFLLLLRGVTRGDGVVRGGVDGVPASTRRSLSGPRVDGSRANPHAIDAPEALTQTRPAHLFVAILLGLLLLLGLVLLLGRGLVRRVLLVEAHQALREHHAQHASDSFYE